MPGVSVQTVLRRFGSRDGSFAEAMDAAMVDAEDERRTPPGDVAAAVRIVVDHYERRGQTALLMLAQEGHDDVARKATDRGKAMHRDWVRDAFAPATDDEALLDLLVVATDVYTWKLLRIDRGHSRAVTERRLHDLVDAVLAAAPATEQGALTWPTSSSSPGTAAATCRPPIGIAAELRRRGHGVRFVGHAAQRAPLEAQGFEVVPPHARARRSRPSTPQLAARDGPDVRRPRAGPRRARRAGRRPADLVVVDCLLFGVMEELRASRDAVRRPRAPVRRVLPQVVPAGTDRARAATDGPAPARLPRRRPRDPGRLACRSSTRRGRRPGAT